MVAKFCLRSVRSSFLLPADTAALADEHTGSTTSLATRIPPPPFHGRSRSMCCAASSASRDGQLIYFCSSPKLRSILPNPWSVSLLFCLPVNLDCGRNILVRAKIRSIVLACMHAAATQRISSLAHAAQNSKCKQQQQLLIRTN